MEIPPAGEQEGVGMKKLWSEVRALGRFLRSRIFAVSMLSLVLAFVVYQITTTTNTVYVIGEDGRTVSHTMENRPDRILQSVGLGALAAGDPGLGEISGHYVQVDTTKSFRVTLTADGETQEYEVDSGTTVSELLHDNGIECFLDVVFNHTAEGNEYGPCFSFKGFDNNVYYMLTPDGYYYNFSGCGNTMNCNHPVVQQLIVSALRYWASAYHVDGFRFDLASILGRNQDGSPMSSPPLLQQLAFDPVLKNVKLIAEAWDAGGLYQVGSFPSWNRWAEWNGRYRDDMRDYLKGGLELSPAAASRITGSADLYDPASRGSHASVNFLNCHDGFTLWDMYSYSQKHNEANGWCNLDGSDDNRSWNCGAEGDTSDEAVLGLRKKLARNAVTVLLMSRGTPMFLAGDEFLNTQYGNNNAYCQDNEISWLDWSFLEKNRDHFSYTKHMIAFRKAHDVIRKPSGVCSLGLPNIKVIPPDGSTHVLAVLYSGRNRTDTADDLVCLAVNVYWEPQAFLLPMVSKSLKWKVEADTAGTYLKGHMPSSHEPPCLISSPQITLESRSVLVFTAAPA